jgi:transglutaminase-like putative cysteine protease/tetratricopeptide (TPR) repeat protein
VITPDLAVHNLDLKTLTDAPAQDEESNIYSDRRVMRGPLPAVASGSVVEEEIVVNESVPFFGAGTLGRSFFGRVSVPVYHSRLTIEAPSSISLRYVTQLLDDVQPQKSENDGRVRIVFERGAIEPLETSDANLPGDLPAYPSVTFSTGASWEQVARDYAAIVESQIKSSDVKALAQKLTEGTPTRLGKIQVVSSYLDKEIRYTGVEFGDSAIIPHSPDETLARKYGDCKDKSALLITMLRAAGVPAYLALLNAGGRLEVPPDLPGMGLFDHAIVYLPGSPDLWIDATDEFARTGQLPISDQGRLALVVRPETTELIRSPEGASQDNLLMEFREVHLAEYGPARIIERTQPHGSSESRYRRSYADKQNKATKDELAAYVKSQYLAEKLDRIDRSNPDDLSGQFELVLESDRAKRGFTDLDVAVAAIRLEGLFDRLPTDLRQFPKDNDSDPGEQKSKKNRTADYQLPEAFSTEWRYTIRPPAEFQPKPLPKNVELHLGPCVLIEEFSSDKDNTVHATLRFDSVKRRLTAAESAELRKNLLRFVEGPPLAIYFEPVGRVLTDAGKIREGLQSYRDWVSAHPKDAVAHLRIARALLIAGLAEGARAEAQAATKLDPNSALSQNTLAEILEYDRVGRKFRPGSDYAGADAAFRAAERLDPNDKATTANLAILLEHDHWGLRYGPGAKLKDAIAEYRKLTAEQRTDLGIQNNLPFALFYAGEFSEAEKTAETLKAPPTDLIVACEAVLNGSQTAMAEAQRRISGEEQFRDVARAAGAMLENLRKYSSAADLKEAGVSEADASDVQAEVSLLRKTRPHEQLRLADDPVGVALRFILLEDDPNVTVEQLRAVSSRNGAVVLALPDVRDYYAKNQRETITEKAREKEFSDIAIDLSIARAQPYIQGNDTSGYKVTLWPSAGYRQSIYVVKEDGHCKVLATSRFREGVGLEALDRIAVSELTGARTLLDWLQEDEHFQGSDDPVGGSPFWAREKKADALKLRLAAAEILVFKEATAVRGISILESAMASTTIDSEKDNIAHTLAFGYDSTRQYEKELALVSELARRYPESKAAFTLQGHCLRALGRLDESDRVAQEWLQRKPGDAHAIQRLILNAIAREDFVRARDLSKKLVERGEGGALELNRVGWYSLFGGRPGESDVDAVLKATQLSNNSWYYLHTLGCLYAELGKLKESRDVLVQALDSANFDEPDENFWYAFGRIAEQAGERDLALMYYGRVTPPKDPFDVPGSTYRLAQTRLKEIQMQAK